MTWRRAAGAALALAAAGPLAAAEWSMQGSMQLRGRYDQEGGTLSSSTRDVRLGAGLNAARSLEHASTRLDLALDLPAWAPDAGRSVQGRAALSQSWATERDDLSAAFDYTADDTLDGERSATDVLFGGSRRTQQSINASWLRRHGERLESRLALRTLAVRLDDVLSGTSYRDSQASASLDWRFSERLRLGAAASASRYAPEGAGNDTDTQSASLSATYAWSEVATAGASLGAWRSRRGITLSGFVCPLPESFCAAGVVARVPVTVEFADRSRGSQYGLSWQQSSDERSRWSLDANRRLSPGPLGVQQSDDLGARWVQDLSPQATLTLAATRSRSRLPAPAPAAGAGGRRFELQTLESTLSWRLAEQLTLNAGASRRRLDEPGTQTGGRSSQFSISLQYQGRRIVAAR